MDLEDVMLSEISQRKINITQFYLYAESKTINKSEIDSSIQAHFLKSFHS